MLENQALFLWNSTKETKQPKEENHWKIPLPECLFLYAVILEQIVEEAGGVVTRMDGGKFTVFDRSVLVSNGAIHEKVNPNPATENNNIYLLATA